MTPCPTRRSEYDAFLRDGRCDLPFARHLEVCSRCQLAFEVDSQLPELLRKIGVELERYPQPVNAMEE